MIDVGGSVGNYIVKSKLGEGGMGIVWLAEHPLIGKRVAIKVIHPSYARNPEAVSRFFTEAQAVNRVGHPNIVDITDFGQSPAGESYFVMEYLSGQSLAQRMQQAGLDLRRAVHVAAQACDALAASHAAGILHRDLKPDNIYLIKRGADPDFVKVLDFGLAKLTGDAGKAAQHKTRTGSMMGTPFYMAPEQCAGKADIDARADIYSMGVILFELVTGKVPFPGEGYGEIIVKHMTQAAPHAREVKPDLPEWLDSVIDRCLAKERTQRVQTMAELGSILSGELDQMPGGAPSQRASTSAGGSSPPRTVTPVPAVTMPPPVAVTVPPSSDSLRPISTMSLAAGEAGAQEFEQPGGPRKRNWMVIGGALGAAAVVLVGVLAMKGGGKTPTTGAAAPATPTLPAAAPVAPPTHQEHAPVPDHPVVVPPPDADDVVSIEFSGSPSGVKITLADGTVVCTATPCTWKPRRKSEPVALTFVLDGYKTRQEQLAPDKSKAINRDLQADRHRHGGSKPPAGDKPPPVDKPPTPQNGSGEDLMKPTF